MYFDKSTSMILHGSEQLLSSCGQTSSSWLFLHLCYVWFLTIFVIFHLLGLLLIIAEYLWTWCAFDHSRIEDFSVYERGDSRLDQFYRYALFEVRLIFTYVSVAFIFTCLMKKQSIHWNEICRWFIEASMVPYTLITIAGVHLGIGDQYFCHDDLTFISPVIYMMKGILFITVRYAELYPSSIVNDYQTFIFYYLCNKSGFHHMPDHHNLRKFLYRS